MSQRQGKYGNRKTEIDGFVFDSLREANRYSELRILEKAGEIFDLELQPEFPCFVEGKKICVYIADFRYNNGKGEVIEDAKGMKTAVYRLKKKLVEALYNFEIFEV